MTPPEEGRFPAWFDVIALLVWALGAAVAFLPFASDTSPWMPSRCE